jgi:two-component system, cell cycle sensor histidine kinase and response regulator CckA
MTVKKDLDDHINRESVLRKAAEDQFESSTGLSLELADQTPEEIIHELQVNQIELEMQNAELKRIQLELEASRNKYQDLYDFAPVAYFTLNLKGFIKDVNLTGGALLGTPRPKLLGRGFGHFVAAESLEQWDQHFLTVLGHEEKHSCVLTLKCQDGSSFYARLESIRINAPDEPQGEDDSGHVIRTAVSDITQSKLLENALRLSEERFRSLFEAMGEGVAIFLAKKDGKDFVFLDFNEAAEEIEQISRNQVIGKSVQEVFPRVREFGLFDVFQRVWRTGNAEHYPIKEYKDNRIQGWRDNYIYKLPSGEIVAVYSDETARIMAAEASKNTQERLDLVLKGADLGFWDLDMLTGRAVVNERAANIIGYRLDEIEPTTLDFWQTLLHPDDIQHSLGALEDHLAGHTDSYESEYRVRAKSGEYKWVLARGKVMERAANGRALRVTGTFQDISERKKAEEDTRESERRFRSITNSVFDAIILIDDKGEISFWNQAAERIFVYSSSEVMGKDVHELLALPEYHAAYRSAFKDFVVSGRGNAIGKTTELVARRKDGEEFPIELSLSSFQMGGHWHAAGIVRDIKERKRVEEQEKLQSTAIEQAAEAVIITDANGVIQYVNKAHEILSGHCRDELIGQTPNVLNSDFHHGNFYEQIWDTIGVGKAWSGRFINRKKDGTDYHEDATISPIYDESGDLTNFVVVQHDVTQQIELQKQLFQAQKMEAIGTLAGGFAHDFRNMLQVVLGSLELIEFNKDLPDKLQTDLDRIRKAATSGAELVKGMLVFSRKTSVQLKPLNLNKLVEQTESLLYRTIPKMIKIDVVTADDLPSINGDSTQIEQILMNLGINAADAMQDGGTLTIQTRNTLLDENFCGSHPGVKPGRYVLLSVTDTGTGMNKETVRRIFEPFFTTKEKGKGTGLGLAVVYGIVEQHAGGIICESKPSVGTAFKIYFPAVEEAPEEQYSENKEPPNGQGETILMVDDAPEILEMGALQLNGANYNVITASNAKEAIKIYEKHRDTIRLVLLDLIMPEMGGMRCLEILRNMDPNVKVLVLTGYTKRGMTQELEEAGAIDFLLKPFDTRRLLEKIRKIIDEK